VVWILEEAVVLRSFEVDILNRFKTWGLLRTSPKGEWIRGHLLDVGEDYPYRMWKLYSKFCEVLGQDPGTYQNFKTYIYLLKRLGLIYPVRREVTNRGFPKTFYAVVPSKELDPAWTRPLQTLYPKTDWKIPEQKTLYRLKYRKKRHTPPP